MRIVKIKRKDNLFDDIPVYNINDFPYDKLRATSKLCVHTKKPKSYKTTIAVFDIEATTIDCEKPYGFMYTWQMNVGGYVIVGRRWEEWLKFMQRIHDVMQITSDSRLCIYIHNAGYEFQFIKDFLTAYFGGFTVFASQERKPIRIETNNGFEFRCSYKLTNMSLAKACENELGVVHPKAEGDLDYKVIRTANTELTDVEWGYIVSDVVSLYELIKNRLKNDKDDFESVPMTSTGYVRRDCRRATRKEAHYRDNFLKWEMTSDIYTLMKECTRGGNTHANRLASGRIWHDAFSLDVVSSYPAQMMLHRFPMTKFYYYGELESMEEFEVVINDNACMFRVFFKDLKLIDSVSMPYVATAKATMRAGKYSYDNGRVLYQEAIALSITDIDWRIIKRQYTWSEIAIKDMYIADYGDLPDSIRGQVMEYFKMKCELKAQIKALEKSQERDEEALENLNYLYAKMKNRLNGIFGMAYTDPVHNVITYDNMHGWETIEAEDIDKALHKFWTNRNSFLYYAWGVWVCAWGRHHLQLLLDITDKGMTLYCDTDSSKALDVNFDEVDKLNNLIKKVADKRGAYYDLNGKRYYMGIYELENDVDEDGKPIPYPQFITLGAKKYAYTELDGETEKLHVTISGVNKKLGAKELKDIRNFKLGFTFKEAGGNTLYYNDDKIHYITVNGCKMLTASNIGMVDSTYTLGITNEYAELIGIDDITLFN